MPRGNRDFTYEVITVASPLQDKSKAFALEIIKVCNEIKRTKRESVLTNQLIRSGTSVGANVREAMYAHSKEKPDMRGELSCFGFTFSFFSIS